MFCPNCAHTVSDDKKRFCSKCGLPIENLKTFVAGGGEIAEEKELLHRKGVRQGAKLVFTSLILLPALIFLGALFPPHDVLIESSPSTTWFEQIGWTIIWTIFLSGVARIGFAFIFERKTAKNKNASDNDVESRQARHHHENHQLDHQNKKYFDADACRNALPPIRETPVSDFGKWKITDELLEPVFAQPRQSGELK